MWFQTFFFVFTTFFKSFSKILLRWFHINIKLVNISHLYIQHAQWKGFIFHKIFAIYISLRGVLTASHPTPSSCHFQYHCLLFCNFLKWFSWQRPSKVPRSPDHRLQSNQRDPQIRQYDPEMDAANYFKQVEENIPRHERAREDMLRK